MSPDQVAAACPLRISGDANDGCCDWQTFIDWFADAWPQWFSVLPTPHQWKMAKSDWRAGNTGWEAAHNAQRRAKEAVARAAEEKLIEAGVIKVTYGRRRL
jgi:hypothetical protein